MTQETLLQIGRLGLAIEDGANMVLDMYRVKEELTGADLFKGEPSEDRSHYAGYTELYKLPGMKDIADDAAEYIKNRLGEVIEEHCKSLEACISALGNTVTAKADKPDRRRRHPAKKQNDKNGFYCAKCGSYISTLTIDRTTWGYKKGSKYYCSYKCMRESCK